LPRFDGISIRKKHDAITQFTHQCFTSEFNQREFEFPFDSFYSAKKFKCHTYFVGLKYLATIDALNHGGI
jgi:hypothetical protein